MGEVVVASIVLHHHVGAHHVHDDAESFRVDPTAAGVVQLDSSVGENMLEDVDDVGNSATVELPA